MQQELVLSGVGGQGILVAAKLLGHAAVRAGRRALYFSMFQGAQRGGVCDCLMALADGRVDASPVIMQPLVGNLSMHPNSFLRFEPMIKPGGLIVYNTSITRGTSETGMSTGEGLAIKADTMIDLTPKRKDITYLAIPATDLALEHLGNQLQATLVALGAFLQLGQPVRLEDVLASMEDALPAHRRHHIPANEKALRLGFDWAKSHAGEVRNPAALRLLGAAPVAS